MHRYVHFLLLLYAATNLCESQEYTRQVIIPPLITKNPEKHMAFVIDESIELPCVATGEPRPEYKWLMNEEDFEPSGNDGRIAIQPGVGTLIFARPLARDEAIYQCVATNIAGTALSVKIDLRRGVLEPFPTDRVREHRVSLGRSLELPCTPPTSYPKPDIFWATIEQDETFLPVDLDDRISMDPDGNLHFAHVMEVDDQLDRYYVCVVQNKVMRSTMHGSYQTITTIGQTAQSHTPTEAYSHPTHQIALKGQTWRVKCIFYGNPTPTVTWERSTLPMPSRKREESFGQEMVISDIEFEDEGSYECVGINDGAAVPIRKSFVLTVESAPYWTDLPPQSVEAVEGDDARFECNAEGIPEPSIYWYINGVPVAKVDADERRTVQRNVMTYQSLTDDDSFVIQCNATNKHGYIYANAYLNVLSEPPQILKRPEVDLKAAEGQTINLTCEVFGSPRPLVVWKKGSEQLTGGRFRVMPNGYLQIQDVSLVDAGTYTCTATNSIRDKNTGEMIRYSETASGSLIVRRKTLIKMPPLDVMVFASTEAKFTCTATTDPEEVHNLRIEWRKDDDIIDYKFAQRMFKNDMDNSLTISGAFHRDTARYTCRATNGLDYDEASAQLIVQDVPDEPDQVEVLCYNQQRSADITWQPGKENYAPILNYIVQYNTSFAPDTWIDIKTDVNVTSRKLTTSLSPWGNYTFRVLARNKIGISPPSLHTEHICRTEADVPAKNPENVIGEGDEPNNLVVFWTPMPPIEWNGDGFYYQIRWKRADLDDEEWQSQRVTFPDAYHLVITETQETYKPFNISVEAGNSMGESSAALDVINGYSGEDIPTVKPMNVRIDDEDSITGTEATISFDPVDTDPESIQGFFRGYRVQFWRSIDGEAGMREQDFIINKPKQYPRPRERRQADDRVVLQVKNLPPYSDIRLQVRILNKYYASAASNRIDFTTKESEPGPPADLQVYSRGSTHVDLQWEEPKEQNGRITSYQMSYQIITGLNLGRIQYRDLITDPEQRRAQLTGLKPNTDYRIYLTAATNIGRGEAIFLDTTTSLPGKPAPPTFDIIDVGHTYVNVSWVPSRIGNPGSVFYVQFRRRGSYHWLHSTDEELDYTMSIEGLDEGSGYQIRVVAKDGQGEETPAEWQEFVTYGVAPGKVKLSTSGWFWGIFVALTIILLLLVLFIFLKRIRDEWWARKEEEIEEQVRQIQAEEAAYEFDRGFVNQYHKGSQENMDTSHASLTGSDYKPPMNYEPDYEDDEYESDHEPVSQPSRDYRPQASREYPPSQSSRDYPRGYPSQSSRDYPVTHPSRDYPQPPPQQPSRDYRSSQEHLPDGPPPTYREEMAQADQSDTSLDYAPEMIPPPRPDRHAAPPPLKPKPKPGAYGGGPSSGASGGSASFV